MAILKLGPGTHTPDASWDGKEVWFDLLTPISGSATIALPAANSLPDGWNCILHKHDPMSQAIEVRPTAVGDSLNHFWTKDCQFGRFMNLTQQTARLSCDGVHDFALSGMTLHRNVPQSQRSLQSGTTWWLGPVSENEIVRCNASSGGVAVVIHGKNEWCPPSQLVGGNYHSFVFQVQKVDDSNNWVAIWMGDGSAITFANGASCQPGQGHDGYMFLTRKGDLASFYMAADGCTLNGFHRPGWQYMGA